jgi:hypothetical protein
LKSPSMPTSRPRESTPRKQGRRNPVLRLKKAVRHFCKNALPKEKPAQGSNLIDELLERDDLTPQCRQALQTAQLIRQNLKKFFQEMRAQRQQGGEL